MRRIKKGLTVLLAAVLMVSSLPAAAAETQPPQSVSESGMPGGEQISDGEQEPGDGQTSGGEQEPDGEGVPDGEQKPGDGQTSGGEQEPDGEGTPDGEQKPGDGQTSGGEQEPDGEGAPDGEQKPEDGQTSGGEEAHDGDESVSGNDLPDNGTGSAVSGNSVSANTVVLPQERTEISFNTGSRSYSVVSRKDFLENGLGDACFEEDGSYTINIPEEDPFFPYEVQFKHEGETINEWFMTPDDSVEIGGHTFYVSASFSNENITRMNLRVGGNTVVVYPEKKEFTEGDGAVPASLLPLERRTLATVDLTGYTPAELTMVSMADVFVGEHALDETDEIVWSYQDGEDNYTVSTAGELFDLSYGTYSGGSKTWEMIVKEADQLAADNIRYNVPINVTASESWITPVVSRQMKTGERSEIPVLEFMYHDASYDFDLNDGRYLEVELSNETERPDGGYTDHVGLHINTDAFSRTKAAQWKIYEGKYTSAEGIAEAKDITAQILDPDMEQKDAGYPLKGISWITMAAFDASGKMVGCLPVKLSLNSYSSAVWFDLVSRTESGWEYVDGSRSTVIVDGCRNSTVTLKKGLAADDQYYLLFSYNAGSAVTPLAVAGIYKGLFQSIAEAEAASAENIKDTVLGHASDVEGYPTDFSQGVEFTVFAGEDGDARQEIYRYRITTEEGEEEEEIHLSGDTLVRFYGLENEAGETVDCYIVDGKEDSYSEYNYLTILVEEDVDLTHLVPLFRMQTDKIHLYTGGSSTPEISGESWHDFSNGPVQYTAMAENGTNARNYWLQVVKAESGAGKLYVNSLAGPEAHTKTENGVIYSQREVMLDGYHDDIHDIFLANMGTEAIPALAVELVSDTVELDRYWTLSGNHELQGFPELKYQGANYGEQQNLAKIRLRAKEGIEAGTEISGTLTLKSGSTTLMVLTLSGNAGDPAITTTEIPAAVKYVPYGTVIQNNNKYSWNQPSYSQMSGRLPAGMMIKPNGELYGVPTQTGEFTFTVRMRNSDYQFGDSTRTYTLTVLENTDTNVNAATDQGYELTQRIQSVSANSIEDQTLVSEGTYGEFVDIFLDGRKLVSGTDYTSESGSTRITISSQTLKASNVAGTHTLGIEFRIKDSDTLKRAAQNYIVEGSGGDTGEDHSSGGDGGSGNSGNSGSGGNNSSPQSGKTESGLGTSQSSGFPGGIGLPNSFPVPGLPGITAGLNEDGMEIIYHTVQAGESLWSIAVQYYGAGDFWSRIFEDNKEEIGDPDLIYAGQILKLRLIPAESQSVPGSSADTAADTDAYIVQKGDTLWKIAEKFYGKGWLWRIIYHANDDEIRNPEALRVGQMIRIPK